MPLDARVDAWATLAQKALPHRAVFELLRALGDPIAVLAASRAQLQAIVPKAAVDRVLRPIPSERGVKEAIARVAGPDRTIELAPDFRAVASATRK